MAEPGKLWTTKELAEAAGVDDSTVRRALIDGKLKGSKVGRDWTIADSEAQRFIAERSRRDGSN